jgi:large subunit ribosomal protein L23
MSKTITLRPRLNEKTYALANSRVYVFEVDKDVNKHTVARAVEAQFEVKVTTVNTTNVIGKAKRIISLDGKRSRNAEGKRSDIKKAYVTLAEGFSLPFFDATEEAVAKEEKIQEKVDKAAAKQAEKTEKAAKPARRGLLHLKKNDAKKDEA